MSDMGLKSLLKLQFPNPCSFSCIMVLSSQQGTVALVPRGPASPSSLQLLVLDTSRLGAAQSDPVNTEPVTMYQELPLLFMVALEVICFS